MALDWGSSPVLFIYTVTHLLAAILSIALTAYIARNYWPKPIGRMFTALVAATSLGVIGTLARLFTTSLDAFVALTVLKYAGIGTAPILFLFVALLYNGANRWVTRRTVSVALAVPVLTLAVAATMRSHGLFYTSFATAPVESFAAIAAPEVGPWYWVVLAYDWGAIVLGTAILVFAGLNRSRFYRYQLAFLLLAVLVSWAANISYAVFSWPHPVLDPTAIGFAVADALLAFAIFGTRMIDITPTARSLVLDAIDDAVIVLDRADRVVDINHAARPLVDSDPVIGEPVTAVLPPEVVQPATSDTVTIELTVDSRQRYFRRRQLPVGPDGTDGTAIVLTDITSDVESRQQIQQANDELEALNTRFELALDATDTGVWEWDLETDEILWDETTERLFGYEPGEFPGTFEAMKDRVHEDDISTVRDATETALETQNEYRAEFRVQPPDDDQCWILARGVVEYDESGDPIRMLGIQTDITERKESEQAIEQARTELRQIIDLIPDPLFAKNDDDEILFSNEANAELLGASPDEIEGKPEPEVMPDVEDYEQYRQRDIDVIETGESTVFEETLTSADGDTHIFQTTRIPFEVAGREEDAVLGYARDVTELKKYEQELEALTTRLQLALEETDTGVWEWNLETDGVTWDEASDRLYGYEPGEFPGTFAAFTDRVHDDDLSAVREELDAAIDSGDKYRTDFRVELPDGNQRWLQARGVVKYDDSGDPSRVIGIQTDITERKESERAVEQAHRELRQIIDLVPDPLYAKNLDDEVLLSNEANAELHGLNPEELEGNRERAVESDVENIDNFDKYRQREIEVVESGEPMTFEEELEGPDGDTYIFRMTRIPFEAAGREEDAVLGYARDVTALKEYQQELEATKRTLEESNERIERTNRDLETLNRILRHDIRNDVVVLTRFGRELEQHVDDDGEAYLQQLLDRAEHIRDLTTGLHDLMTTMLEEDRELRPVRLDTVLEAEIRDVTETYENAVVTTESDIPQVPVRADQMLASVFRNLLKNAIQHNDREAPEVTVSARERESYVAVRIADNGPGIPEDIRDDIFGKGEKGLESKGTGIGLYLVSQLIDEYGGEVSVEDNDPRGAVFVVELERVQAEQQHPAED